MDNTMIDLHNHLLPGIDDGAKDFEESAEILHHLAKQGIKEIVLTPHYIENSHYCANQLERERIRLQLLELAEKEGITLYLGNEVFVTPNMISLLERHEISTINQSKYLLVELPRHEVLHHYQEIFCELNSAGVVPIIAHPERYEFLQNDKTRVKELLEFDCLLQCNLESLTGKYGKKAQKLVKWLLKKDLVQFVATDTHHLGEDKIEKSMAKLTKIVGKEKARELLHKNPQKVIRDEEVFSNMNYIIELERRR